MYYPSSENKGADLHLCFRLCRLLIFPWGGSVSHQLLDNLGQKMDNYKQLLELSLIEHFTYRYIGGKYCDISIQISIYNINIQVIFQQSGF